MTLKPFREYRFSLRARATSWYVGLLAVALIVFSVGVYASIQGFLKHSLQRTLTGTAQTISAQFLSRLQEKGDAWVLGEIRESYSATATDHFVRISSGARVLFRSADMLDPSIAVDSVALPRQSDVPAFHRQYPFGMGVLVYTLPFRAVDGRVFEVECGASLLTMQQTLHFLVKLLLVSNVAILLLAAIGGFLLMKQPLRPLVVLTEKASKIGGKELGERLPVIPTGDELERLTISLNSMIERLEEALNHNHRFSADASHELRTPLTIMRGEIEEMLRMEGLPALAIENLVSTIDEIDRMSSIVNSLMTITRLDAGGERMDRQTVDISGLVRTTVEHMRLLAEEKGLPLTCACEREIVVRADPMRIKQVLVNLIDNAIKYSPSALIDEETASAPPAQGNVRGGVDIAVYRDEAHAVLRVSDAGIGISPEVLPHVFERFYRADYARSRGAGGVGLGLAIVKAIVTAHEGTVSISSFEGRGTTVQVVLALADADASQASLPAVS